MNSFTKAFRDAPIGQIIRFLSGKRLLLYPEERPGFKLPQEWLDVLDEKPETQSAERSSSRPNTGASPQRDTARPTEGMMTRVVSRGNTRPYTAARIDADEEHEIQRLESLALRPERTHDGAILVDWYATDDPENPLNWARSRRLFVTVLISLYTYVVYSTSAIYTPSYPGVMAQFGVSELEASLGLSLYVLGYGVGPLLFSPLSEIARIGRSPIYAATMFAFVIISIPTALAPSYPALMVLRFLQGFFGSPCLASGAASLSDIYDALTFPYALIAWTAAAFSGPALGPLLSGFSVPVKGWRWSLLEALWASIPIFLLMILFLPETSGQTLLLHRAQRLRALTGNRNIVSQSEVDQANIRPSAIVFDALVKPFEITIKDPAMLFVQIYTAIIYGIYYSFFDVFPLVYGNYYNLNAGQTGLIFLCILVACLIGISIYVSILYFNIIPNIKARGLPVNERWLVPALVASLGPTVGLFIFAWTSKPSIHWIVPTIGITLYSASAYVLMQCIFTYVPMSYPKYAASLFAANDFCRSAFAFGSILFAQPLYANLGVARGTSLLGGLSVTGVIGIWVLYIFGARLRSKSKFAGA